MHFLLNKGHFLKSKKNYIFLFLLMGVFHSYFANADLIEGIPLRGFTDASYIYDKNLNSNSFKMGEVDFFLAKKIDQNVNVLMELVFQPNDAGIDMDIERSYIQYVANPWFKFEIGRFHTALGYWNDTYHHGNYLQTSVSRPKMLRFEDKGGLLPTHTTGIEIRGSRLIGTGNLVYIVNVGNGRGPVKNPPAFSFSYNKSKSINGLISYEFDNGVRFGGSLYHSNLPGGYQHHEDGSNNLSLKGPTGDELIFGSFFVYNSPEIEFLSEYARINHDYTDGNLATQMNTFYAQFGYHLGLFTPYLRYEINTTNVPDAYFNADTGALNEGLLNTTHYYTLGARYELSAASALKLEFASQNTATANNWSGTLNWSVGW